LIHKKRLGILTGGGDVPPLNALIKSVCKSAEKQDVDILGFWKGWEGFFLKDGFVNLRSNMIDERIGGTFLKTSRMNLEKVDNGVEKVLQRLQDLEIRALIVIGGEDTLSNALLLNGFPQILISKTIDNDVGKIESNKTMHNITNYFTLGFPTALRKITSFVCNEEGLRTTAYAHERIIIMESMGMHAGWLALSSILGKPDFIIIPEFPLDYNRFLSLVTERYLQKKHAIVVIAEGAKWDNGNYISCDYDEMDQFGHPCFRGAAEKLCTRMKKDLAPYFDTRNVNFVNPSYLYRCGMPCDLDYEWGKRLGQKAVELGVRPINESVFLSIQRNSRGFFVESYPVKDMGCTIEKFHRFVDDSFYNSGSFSATNRALEYFHLFE